MKILAINPGSTSTKIAVFEDEKNIFSKTITHTMDELKQYKKIYDQKDYRKKLILDTLAEENIQLNDINGFVARGGLVRPLKSGVYKVNDAYLHDAKIGLQGQHASNLGGVLAYELAKTQGKDAYVVDPVTVDEYQDIARISGIPEISRVISFHPLNHKAVARRYAAQIGKSYEDLNLIVAHIGGGISIGAHKNGQVIDVNAALGGDGPFSPERAGGVPPLPLIKMCYSGQYTFDEMYSKIAGSGGVYAYLGTKDMREVEKMIDAGDKKAKLILDAMTYQIAKEIGGCAVVLEGNVDAIIITGGIAFSKRVCDWIVKRVKFITNNIIIYPGEGEMEALAKGVLDVLQKRKSTLEY
jgi:butyrate kinase